MSLYGLETGWGISGSDDESSWEALFADGAPRVAARAILYSWLPENEFGGETSLCTFMCSHRESGYWLLPGGGIDPADCVGREGLIHALFGAQGTLERELREEMGMGGGDRDFVFCCSDALPVSRVWWTNQGLSCCDYTVAIDISRIPRGLLSFPRDGTMSCFKMVRLDGKDILVDTASEYVPGNIRAALDAFCALQRGERKPDFCEIDMR